MLEQQRHRITAVRRNAIHGPVPSELLLPCSDGEFIEVDGSYGQCTGTYYLECADGTWSAYACEPTFRCEWCPAEGYGDAGDTSSPIDAADGSSPLDAAPADAGPADTGVSTDAADEPG
jgi:hypothetical protein